jgi:hypothetical protein
MADIITELERLALADGATFMRTPFGAWWAKDKDGLIVVRGALSKFEAALRYCDDRDLIVSSPEAILTRIKHQFRPYDTMPEFRHGFEAYQAHGFDHGDAYEGVKAQAWDRGVATAMLFARAMAHLSAHTADGEKAGSGWLERLLRTGRC